MAINVNTVAQLKADRVKSGRGDTLTDADYIIRDKDEEAKIGTSSKNTRDITANAAKHNEEFAKFKAEAKAEAKAEMSGEMAELKAQMAALVASMKPKAPVKGAK